MTNAGTFVSMTYPGHAPIIEARKAAEDLNARVSLERLAHEDEQNHF